MSISIVHVDIKLTQGNFAELRVFGAVASAYGRARSVTLDAIQDLVGKAETSYYTADQEDFLKLGKRLYEWVDGDDRVLSRAIAEVKPEVIAISAVEGLAHLPWEMLADGAGFLVGRGIVPVRWVSMGRDAIECVNAPKLEEMKLMLMATDPTESTSLEYEKEEGRILEATARSGLELVVEESGCLEELALLVRDYGTGYFDAFHLTGHATSDGVEPRFGMESQTGELALVTAQEIARSFGGLPPLVFLSGCQTGKLGQKGAVASMSERLVRAGALAVLGWGETVADVEASLAAEVLYGELAAGRSVVAALAETYRRLMTDARDYRVRDWHKLRLYVGDRLPGELVVPLRLQPKKKTRVRLSESEFLDGAGLVKVASRSTFVGRRRVLQRSLRVLQGSESVGLLLYGLGGNGKSSVAARLCDRLYASALRYQRVVIFGAIDEAGFVNALSQALVREPDCVAILNESGDLRSRLVRALEMTTENWLFVMDDFEALSGGVSLNLDERSTGYVMKPMVAAVMGAIESALWDCNGRLLITSRYEVAGLSRVERLPLGAMDDREMIKKRRQLDYIAKIAAAVEPEKSAMQALQDQAERLADGNPRLLMWLDRVLCEVTDPREILAALEARAIEFREDVLAEKLLALLGTKERKALARGLVFEIGVPRAVFESVVEFGDFGKAISLGLLAVGPDGTVRVVRLLGLEVPQDEALAATAAQAIYEVWGKSKSEVQRLEIHRLAIEGKVGTIAGRVGAWLSLNYSNNYRYGKSISICRKTLAVIEDYRIFHNLAHAEYYLGNKENSLRSFQKAIDLCPDNQHRERSNLMHNQAIALANQGYSSEALDLHEESFQIQLAIGDEEGIAANLHAIANEHVKQGKLSEAIEIYEESLRIQRVIGAEEGIAANLHQIASVYIHQRKMSKAIVLYKESLEIHRLINNQQGMANTLAMLAQMIASHQKDFGTAIDYLQESEAILRRIGSPNAETVARILQQVERMKN